jgi:hypothetical protein
VSCAGCALNGHHTQAVFRVWWRNTQRYLSSELVAKGTFFLSGTVHSRPQSGLLYSNLPELNFQRTVLVEFSKSLRICETIL